MKQLISGPTFSHKVLVPAWFLCLSAWMVYLWLKAHAMPENGQQVGYLIGLLLLGYGGLLYCFKINHFPLKQVWLLADGLRVSNYRDEVDVSFGSIASIVQKTNTNPCFIIIQLRNDTIFGRRFTFIPKDSPLVWFRPRSEDAIVAELRKRVEAAHQSRGGEKPNVPIGDSGRSIMADDELDGPF